MSEPPPIRRSASPLPAAETIAARDLNNLYLSSCYFADPRKYAAFCELYALMRVIDDRIDDLPLRASVSAEDRRREHAVAEAWEEALFLGLDGAPIPATLNQACEMAEAEQLVAAAISSMRRFPFPTELWRNFFTAMRHDIEGERFARYDDFLGYTEGASVAPTTIYLYLIVARDRSGRDVYLPPPGFDLVGCGRHLGLSSYLAHILRDLAKDLQVGTRGLLYLATADLASVGLTEEDLRRDLEERRARPELRRLVAELTSRARQASAQGADLLAVLDGELEPDCAFVLELIRVIYDRLLDKLESVDFDPFAEDHELTLEEKYETAVTVAQRHGISLAAAGVSPWAGIAG